MAMAHFFRRLALWGNAGAILLGAAGTVPAHGYAAEYHKMSFSVKTALRASLLRPVARPATPATQDWLDEMSRRLRKHFPHNPYIQNKIYREALLLNIRHEAYRAGLNPQLVLAIIHVESAFNRYALSRSYARGLMQIMPFWTKEIGDGDAGKLFDPKTNLRYGTVILKHYLEVENGNVRRALARYNGSIGRAKYPNLVLSKLKRFWQWT